MAKKKKPIKILFANIGHYKAMGMAYPDDRVIIIDKKLKGLHKLDTILHEVTHCQFPKLPEITVNARSTELAKILWDCGLRFIDFGENN